jgi:uncharacterized protein YndB with AHSA1/START domain
VTHLTGDQARVTVAVEVEPGEAFRAFVEDIDEWWRHGLKFRAAGKRRGIIVLEPRLGGRLFESFETPRGSKVVETGRVTCFDPPNQLAFEWRNTTFASHEVTLVHVRFDKSSLGTRVTLTHSGWGVIRPDHPARHRQPPAAFIRGLGLWWGDQLTSFRIRVAPPD